MKRQRYLFDTHALIFWSNKSSVSKEFIKFFDEQSQQGDLYVSSISFWEVALLVQKGRISLPDVHAWKDGILQHTNISLIEPSAAEMIDSALLPPHHKDPFDRLLIVQANRNDFVLVTQDREIQKYGVTYMWVE